MNQPRPQEHGRGGSPVFGVFVLGIGVVLLLNVLGVLGWEIWLELWRWWPLALVLAGAGLLMKRVHPIVMTLVSAGALTAAVLLSWATAEGSIGPYETTTTTFSANVESVTDATLDIDFGAGDLVISALQPESDFLIDATFEDHRDGPRVEVERSGNTADIELRTPSGFTWFGSSGGREWDIFLHPDIAYTIDLDGGASSYNLDLRDIDAASITLDTGASSLDLIVPDREGHTDVRINGGASSMDITIPDGIAARIQVDAGLTSVDVDESRFPKVSGDHVSPDYETAVNRVDLVIAAGVSSITVR